jgi:hypothetical protein
MLRLMAAEYARIIDAAVRFMRTNPELVAYARSAAPQVGLSVDEILSDAVRRLRAASLGEPVAQEQVIA